MTLGTKTFREIDSLAVFPEAEGLTDDDMMKIAREMNLSETVFAAEAG